MNSGAIINVNAVAPELAASRCQLLFEEETLPCPDVQNASSAVPGKEVVEGVEKLPPAGARRAHEGRSIH
jgi:hypothetical protein